VPVLSHLDGADLSGADLEGDDQVGYESTSQFSREYARQFGVPPSHDPAEATGLVDGSNDARPAAHRFGDTLD
jgi:hypothetical protein